MVNDRHPMNCTHSGGLLSVNVTDAAGGDLSPGFCVGKADVSEGAGSPALSFPW